jgi:hypothetical protein
MQPRQVDYNNFDQIMAPSVTIDLQKDRGFERILVDLPAVGFAYQDPSAYAAVAPSAQTQSEGTSHRTKLVALDRIGPMAVRRPDESSVGV